MTPCIYLKKMPQKCLNHYPTNNSIWDTWYVSTRYLDIYLVYIVHTRRFHTKKMLTKMGLRATIQLLDAICQPHVRKALVKGTTRKYFCLFVWRHLKFIFLVAFACCWLSAAAAWLWICREVLRSGNLSPLKKTLPFSPLVSCI